MSSVSRVDRASRWCVAAAAFGTGVVGACAPSRPQAGGTGALTPLEVTRAPVPVAPGERRPERTSALVRVGTCDRLAQVMKPRALQALTADGDLAMAWTLGAATESTAQAAGGLPAPQAGRQFSTTNVQEAGVDEPDRVKTDGRLLVTSVDGRLRVLEVTGSPRLLATLDLPGGGGDLLLVGDRVLVLGRPSGDGFIPAPGAGSPTAAEDDGGARPRTTVTVVDLADPAAPVVARTHTIDGTYLDARLVGGVARIITRSQPDLPVARPTGRVEADDRYAAGAAAVRDAEPAAFLPRGASCADAYVAAEPSGVGTVAVQSLDPAADAPGPAVTVVTDASTVYASAGRLFVATAGYGSSGGGTPAPGWSTGSRSAPVVAGPGRTAIHAFDITDPLKARYVGSGDVAGHLLNQFSLSEHQGVLRVATTLAGRGAGEDGAPADRQSQSRVTVLRPAGEEWVETGVVDGLGRGERIYAVRFLGATGYVVTFRQVDPLYVLDLADPRSPRLTGELKITGYSAYLHPAGERRLLGLGQEATDQGRRLGSQLSLFDVGDPAAPTKLAGAVLPQASSTAEDDHHAFLYWPAARLAVAPVASSGRGEILPLARPGSPTSDFVGAVAFRVGDTTLTEAARITHPGSTPIDRSLVVGDRLLTVSRVGVSTNVLASLADAGFLAFR